MLAARATLNPWANYRIKYYYHIQEGYLELGAAWACGAWILVQIGLSLLHIWTRVNEFPLVRLEVSGARKFSFAAHLAGLVVGCAIGYVIRITTTVKEAVEGEASMAAQYLKRDGVGRIIEEGEKESPPSQSMPRSEVEVLAKQVHQLAKQGDVDLALQAYSRLRKEAPDRPIGADCITTMAKGCLKTKKYRVAATLLEDYVRTSRRNPNAPEIKFILAMLYIRDLKRPDRGRQLLEEVVMEHQKPDRVAAARRVLSTLEGGA